MEASKGTTEKQTPPYISFATFNNALSSIMEHGLPSQIDRSVLRQFSGFNQSLLFHALRFMGLTNEKDEPTVRLHDYESATPDARKAMLATILKERYPEQVKILPNGTSQKLKDSFNDINVEASVKKKCISYFLQCARATDIKISDHIINVARSRVPRKDRVKKKVGGGAEGAITNRVLPPGHRDKPPKGMVQIPISIGIDKIWTLIMDEGYTKDDVDRFLQIVQITLGTGGKK